jgi:uncharacterized membrane protein
MVKAQLAIVGLYAAGSLLILTAFYNWRWWIMWGQHIHLFWVILSSVLAAVIVLQASVFAFQILDKWYFLHKAKQKEH